MSCVCAKYDSVEFRYMCDITGDECFYLRPNQDACAEKYGEVEHTKKWNQGQEGMSDENLV